MAVISLGPVLDKGIGNRLQNPQSVQAIAGFQEGNRGIHQIAQFIQISRRLVAVPVTPSPSAPPQNSLGLLADGDRINQGAAWGRGLFLRIAAGGNLG